MDSHTGCETNTSQQLAQHYNIESMCEGVGGCSHALCKLHRAVCQQGPNGTVLDHKGVPAVHGNGLTCGAASSTRDTHTQNKGGQCLKEEGHGERQAWGTESAGQQTKKKTVLKVRPLLSPGATAP